MLRKLLLTAMGLVIVHAWIATVKAQNGPAPAEKAAKPKAAADDDQPNPFGGPAPQGLRPFGKATVPMQKAAQDKPAAKQPQPRAAAKVPLHGGEKAILKALEEETTLNFTEETPLQEVVEYLQNKHGIPIKLDAPALKEAGVGLDTPITCSLSGVPLRSALRIVSSDLGLAWTIWSDVLWITSPTKAESDECMITKVYDVSDLVVETRDRPYRGNGLPTIEADEPVGGMGVPACRGAGMGGMGGMGGGMGMGGSGSGGIGGSGSGGMGGGMGGGMFSVPPEASAPATISASGSTSLRMVIGCVPVVGSAERGNGAGLPSSSVPPQISAAMGGMPSCCGCATANPPSFSGGGVGALMDLIENTIATKSWGDNGGSGAISSQPGNLLCVTQTFQIHCEIKELLADLRAQRRAVPNVVVELQWLWLDGGQYQQLLGGAKHSDDEPTHIAVDAKALDRLGRTAPGFRGRIACANGQLVHLASGDRRSIIVNTVSASGGGPSPVVQTPNAGVVVQVRPSVVPGGKTAIVDLQSVVTRWGKPQATAPAGAASGNPPVQQANMPAQQFATTVRVPLGKPVLLGGMTFAPTGPAGLDKASDDPAQLYLIATTSIAE